MYTRWDAGISRVQQTTGQEPMHTVLHTVGHDAGGGNATG